MGRIFARTNVSRFIFSWYEIPVRINQLSKREIDICRRLKNARERIGKTQEACAREVGIERTTLANLELGRAPVRYEVALRFCRNLIINEEWLATGKFHAMHRAALEQPELKNNKEWRTLDFKIFFRHTVDLLSEPVTNRIPPGTLFSEAFDKYFAPQYSALVVRYFYLPRIVFNEADNPELGLILLTVLQQKWLTLLEAEAERLGKNPNLVARSFTRAILQSGSHIFQKFVGHEVSGKQLQSLDWLKQSLESGDVKLGPLQTTESETEIANRSSSEIVAA